MNLILIAVRDGFLKALKTLAIILKVVLPVYAIVVLIRHSPVMGWLELAMTPTMKLFHLPSTAVVPLVTGFFTDEYSVVAASKQFGFSTMEMTTIAMMTMVAHGLPVEAAIIKKIGLSPVRFTAFRLASFLIIGWMVGWMGGMFPW